MKDLTYFRLINCPFCKRAEKWMDELMEENPAYKTIKITTINENEQSDLADSYNYFYVPCFYHENTKLHEGAASKEIIKNVLDFCL